MRCTPRGGGGGTTTASFTWTITLKGWGLYLYFNLKPLTEHVGHKWRDCGSSCDNTELTVSLGEKGRVCECVFCRGGVVADWHSGMDGGLFFWKRLLFQGKTKGPHRAPCSPDFTCYHLSALGLNKASLFPQVGWSSATQSFVFWRVSQYLIFRVININRGKLISSAVNDC